MKTRTIYVGSGENNCPADALMADFRRTLSRVKYSKNIEFSETCVAFFREMADIVNETEDNARFRWYEVPEQNLPQLEVKLRKKGGKYTLMYLKEFGDEMTIIEGKQGKGKNKDSDEKLVIVKRTKEQEPKSTRVKEAKSTKGERVL